MKFFFFQLPEINIFSTKIGFHKFFKMFSSFRIFQDGFNFLIFWPNRILSLIWKNLKSKNKKRKEKKSSQSTFLLWWIKNFDNPFLRNLWKIGNLLLKRKIGSWKPIFVGSLNYKIFRIFFFFGIFEKICFFGWKKEKLGVSRWN